ncbi:MULTISPECIES: hypothetical protein [unclassified Geodermatophilus]|uniref:hypothetical protein n=1 Tax=unclassified Geodermatophilus TaxID=2637632 RepID=UPI003EECA400
MSPLHTPVHPSDAPHRSRRTRRLVLHYLEMVVAMAVGMVALHPVWQFVLDAFGAGAVLDRPEPMALVMATNMTIGMTAVMRWRRHSWRACAEMGAAMYLPFVVLFVPMWAGVLSTGGLMLWGHALMLVAMAGVMALRPSEYAHC